MTNKLTALIAASGLCMAITVPPAYAAAENQNENEQEENVLDLDAIWASLQQYLGSFFVEQNKERIAEALDAAKTAAEKRENGQQTKPTVPTAQAPATPVNNSVPQADWTAAANNYRNTRWGRQFQFSYGNDSTTNANPPLTQQPQTTGATEQRKSQPTQTYTVPQTIGGSSISDRGIAAWPTFQPSVPTARPSREAPEVVARSPFGANNSPTRSTPVQKPAPQSKPQPVAKPEPQPVPKSEPQPVVAQPKPQPAAEADQVAQVQPAQNPQPVQEPEPIPQPEPVVGEAKLSWSIPTKRENGDDLSLAEIAAYEIYVTAENAGTNQTIRVDNRNQTQYTVEPLSADTYYFSMVTIDVEGVYSELSQVVSKTID